MDDVEVKTDGNQWGEMGLRVKSHKALVARNSKTILRSTQSIRKKIQTKFKSSC
jgi:hypothetical protein